MGPSRAAQEKSPTKKSPTTQQPVFTHGGLLHARLPVALQLACKIKSKCPLVEIQSISGLVAEYIVAIDVTGLDSRLMHLVSGEGKGDSIVLDKRFTCPDHRG